MLDAREKHPVERTIPPQKRKREVEKARRRRCPIDAHTRISRGYTYKSSDTPPVMVYLVARLFCGVRTVLSFYGLRRHPPVFFPREQARFLVSLRSRSPPALSERDHLFTGRCDLVIPPLSRDLPRSPLNSGRKSAHRRRRMKKAAALLESNDLAESARGR